jgi:hypothetical protein
MNASIILRITSVFVGVSYPRECYNIYGSGVALKVYEQCFNPFTGGFIFIGPTNKSLPKRDTWDAIPLGDTPEASEKGHTPLWATQ